MIADIAAGHGLAADWLFLVAAVLAFLCAVGSTRPRVSEWPAAVLGWAAITCLAVAWLVL